MPLNRGYWSREQVGASAGSTVLAHLAAHHRHSSRDEWSRRLAAGELELDGATLREDVTLRAGQVLVWHRPAWEEPDVPRQYTLLHEDAALVAVDKPRGLPTMPGGGFLEGTLLALVRERYPEARPLHRLGRHTSGIVLFARTHAAAALLAHAWRNRRWGKSIVRSGAGVPAGTRRAIDAPIGPVPSGAGHRARCLRVRKARAQRSPRRRAPRGRDVVRRGDCDGSTAPNPDTPGVRGPSAGRRPSVARGGALRGERPGLPGDGGYLLHAARLRFVHPLSNEPFELSLRPPQELCTESELAQAP